MTFCDVPDVDIPKNTSPSQPRASAWREKTLSNLESFPTAVKALVLVGVSDLCLTIGIIMTGFIAGTFEMDKIHLPLNYWGSFAFIFLMIGAIGKAGSMPFHSWIPDAAIDAPLPFMAFLPAALEKLLGIYFLTRISIDLFAFNPGTLMSIIMMSIGAITIILAVMMALVQTLTVSSYR
jgi:formate hydrogenlyase subunit 3/multisubunit Na+/H+ antiporter MnhD subunit